MSDAPEVDATLVYYEEFSADFIATTLNVDMKEHHTRFLRFVPPHGSILDLGCGSGRDSLAFLQGGYDVTSVDGSQAMVDATSALTGHPARKLRFDELDYCGVFDGVWACASLLHVPRDELSEVMRKVMRGLRSAGIVYVSFKTGDEERSVNGRHFTDFTMESLRAWVALQGFANVEEIWETGDVREGRSHEGWVNAILTSTLD